MKRLIFLVCATASPGITRLSFATQSCPSPMVAWTGPAMERIAPQAAPRQSARIELWAAGGEYQSAQVIVRACGTLLTNVAVSVSDLKSAAGRSIGKSHVALYREHYVYVKKASPDPGRDNRPQGPGWYPDALIPFNDPETTRPLESAAPFKVSPGRNQPIWIDVFVPRGTAPGEYAGVVAVTADQGSTHVPLRLVVRNFELPLSPSLKTSFGMHEPLRSDPRIKELLLEHRIMPTDASPNEAPALMKSGLSTIALRVGGEADREGCTMPPPPGVDEILSKARRYPRDLSLYLYPADEIDRCPNIFETVRRWGRNVHAADPRIKMLASVMPRPPLLDDGTSSGRSAVDIWVLLPKMYDGAHPYVDEAIKKGDEVWSYTALVQESYSPKWEIDFTPANYRIQPGFMSAALGFTGLLYWRIDLWTNDPWNDVTGFFEGQSGFPGEGMLVYPGKQIGYSGVVPSMRLKYIREGIQDFEYVQIAKRLGRGMEAREIVRSVAVDWKNWTNDSTALDVARRRLGDLNEKGPVDISEERPHVRNRRVY